MSHKAQDCTGDKLYGEWIFINYYKGKLTDIRQLATEDFKSEWGTPVMTYNKTGTYVNDQGDYSTKGNFILDSNKCLLKKFNDNGATGDTSFFEITYLDDKYLVVVKLSENPYSYFYKRK